MQNRQTGFTLIELMIVIAIVGILAAIAVPQYGSYVTDARRTDGHIALRAAAQEMERCRTRKFSYEDCPLNITASDDNYYNITLGGVTSKEFKLTAKADTTGPQASDTECLEMTVDQLGVTEPPACW